jgi:hypothetical protein
MISWARKKTSCSPIPATAGTMPALAAESTESSIWSIFSWGGGSGPTATKFGCGVLENSCVST